MYEPYKQFCKSQQATGKYRELPVPPGASGGPELDFSSNDYLGLSRHPALWQAAVASAHACGVGATGSRLLSGNWPLFSQLEARIAMDKRTEAALLFSSGFQANASVLSCLLDSRVLKKRPLVFFDRLNHASLYQAVALSGAELIRYRHLDYMHLRACLERYAHDTRPKFIVSETVFGMDGDVLALDVVAPLAVAHRALLYLDEAHAVGVLGTDGYGLSTSLTSEVTCVSMGTFSKALGVAGGYVACNQVLKDYFINRAVGFMYSTASSPMVIAAASKAWELLPSFESARFRLVELADSLRQGLVELGFNTGTSSSHIVPLIDASLVKLQRLQQTLVQSGIRVSLVRPPSVPPGTSRLRMALNANHTEQDVQKLLRVLAS